MPRSVDYFSDAAIRQDLGGKTVRGGAVTAVAQAAGLIVQFGSIPLLTRLLYDADFGLVAMVTVLVNFGAMFVDAGLSTATVQRPDITHRQVSNLFWIGTSLGLVLATLVACLSPAVAWFYSEPRLTAITLALAISYVLSGLTLQHQALLRRTLQFKQLAAAQFSGVLAGQAAGVAWAYTHRDQPDAYWALVLIPIVNTTARLVATWVFCGWRPSLPSRGAGTRDMVVFGANMTGASFTNYFARNADRMLLGLWQTPGVVGLYDVAYRVLLLPLQQIDYPLSSVAAPAMSRLKDDPERYRSFFVRGTRLSTILQAPVVIFAFLFAEECFLVVLGDRFLGSVPVFQWLFPAALMGVTAPASRWVYLSWGHTDRLFIATIANSLFVVTGFLIAAPYGAVAVAASFSLTISLLRPPNILYCFRGTPLRWTDLVQAIWPPLVASIVAGAVAFALTRLAGLGEMPVATLLVGAFCFALVYALILALSGDLRNMVALTESFRRRSVDVA